MYEDDTIKREGRGNHLEGSLKEFVRRRKGCEEDVMESRTIGRKVFLYESFVYI